MTGIELMRTQWDDSIWLSKGYSESLLEHVEEISIRLRNANLKVNVVKFTFCKTEIDSLGYEITREEIKSQ